MSDINPYRPPAALVFEIATATAADANFLPAGRVVDAARGWNWITDAFALFKKQPGNWILVLIVGVAITAVLHLLPIVGLVSGLLFPVFNGGLMLGCRALDSGEQLTVGHLFAGFKENTSNLVLVGVIVGVLSMLIAVPVMLAAVGPAFITLLTGGRPDFALFGLRLVFGGLIVAALLLPVYMAMWFAPALVVLNGMSATAALKASFTACLRNVVPFLVYGVLMLVLYFVAMIPLALGLLVYLPVMFISIYTAYRDIFYTQ